MNKIKYLAALLIGVAGLGLQQAQATTLNLENQMHWSTNDPYLIGTVVPGLNANGGQAARDAAMTNTLLGMATPSQAGTWGDQSDPLYSRTTLNTTGYPVATVAGNSLGSGILDGGARSQRQRLTVNFEAKPTGSRQSWQIRSQSVTQIHHCVDPEIGGQPPRFFNPRNEA